MKYVKRVWLSHFQKARLHTSNVSCYSLTTLVLSSSFQKAIADVEKAVIETLDRQYADVLSPLKENIMPIKLGLKYVQKITKGTVTPFAVCKEVSSLVFLQ